MKNTRLYVSITLAIQSLTFLVMVIIFLCKDKKNTAGAFFAAGLLGAVSSAMLMAAELKEKKENMRIIDAINELCSEDEDDAYNDCEISVDDTASESDFG